MPFRPATLIALVLAALPAAASAQGADPDVKCMMVSNAVAVRETDPQKKQIAIVSVSYYLGRASTRLNAAQFRAAVLVVGKQAIGTDIGPVMTACARALQTRQLATAKILQDLQRAAGPAKP